MDYTPYGDSLASTGLFNAQTVWMNCNKFQTISGDFTTSDQAPRFNAGLHVLILKNLSVHQSPACQRGFAAELLKLDAKSRSIERGDGVLSPLLISIRGLQLWQVFYKWCR